MDVIRYCTHFIGGLVQSVFFISLDIGLCLCQYEHTVRLLKKEDSVFII